ncbi:MAG: RNA-binding S4 domain-containing protein [Acidobacteria bacterium]|nr:RNA-binding S4 domain-containing protein [Acidobacteriota bacterium]
MSEPPAPRVRLDVWLDVVCLFRTRSEAQKACQAGRVEVGGQRAKPHRELRIDDRLTIHRPMGRRQQLVVKGLAERHLPKAEARKLYEDVTPAPTPEEAALRQMAALARPLRPAAAPGSRERRTLRRLKEEWGD